MTPEDIIKNAHLQRKTLYRKDYSTDVWNDICDLLKGDDEFIDYIENGEVMMWEYSSLDTQMDDGSDEREIKLQEPEPNYMPNFN